MLSYALSFLAGTLTAISPCVLPALPLIVGSAAQEHRHAPLAVAAGMILSFTFLGVFFATTSLALGIDQEIVRAIAAVTLLLFGIVLLVPVFQDKMQGVFAPIAGAANSKLSSGKFKGLTGQFALGGLLGAVWSPCVGPTLGGAVGLASQSGGLVPATLMMLMFGVGSAVPLLFIAYGSRRLFLSNRGNLLKIGRVAKPALGAILTLSGVAILAGWDKAVEAALLNSLPQAWTDLITSF